MAIQISRVLHAGYVFESGGTRLLFDPIFESPFSRNCFAFPATSFDLVAIRREKFDAVFISHFHDDHCSLESLSLIERTTPIFIYCVHEEILELVRALGFHSVLALNLNELITVGGFEVTPLRALDEDVDSIFHMRAAGLNILNVVDSWICSETMATLQKTKWDLVLWPFQTMRELEALAPTRAHASDRLLPLEWLEQLAILRSRAIVPSSCQFQFEPWSWLNATFFPISYSSFSEQVHRVLPSAEILRLDPGESLSVTHTALTRVDRLPWITSAAGGDYQYSDETAPSLTSEIAKHFPALKLEQQERVQNFCLGEIMAKHNSFGVASDRYWLKPRRWRLSLFDHRGARKDFNYLLDEDVMSVSDDSGPLAWTTELPAAKLYAALELGDSLTSMYVRINADVFSSEIEVALGEADIMTDPLLRCLFGNDVGGYQKWQLKRLRKEQNVMVE